ncbi:MAG: hypothetical protein WEE64_12565 [Dehalococcoidia bacterium]
MQCATHPSVETELACGKCGKPICPRCLVYTPVGTRCRTCANVRRLPQYHISAAFLLRGAAAALVVGVGVGVLWGFLLSWDPGIFYFGFFAGLGLGYAVGEAVSLATNRKVGPPLQAIAVAGVVLAYLVRCSVLATRLGGVGIIDIATDDLFGYIVVGMGAFIAAGRLR